MKTIIMAIVVALAALALTVNVRALDWSQVTIGNQGGNLFATISPYETYTNTFSIDTSSVNYQSCHDSTYYQLGSCDYIYKCYIIMPQSCSEVACAKAYDCTEITSLANPESLTVAYAATSADITKTYAVSAFIMKSHMNYDFALRKWTDTTTPYDETLMYDSIEVQGAPVPPVVNPLEKIGQFISNILAGLQNWICNTLHIWC